MQKLTDLPNIGKTLAEKLNQIGVNNRLQLAELGSEGAIIRIAALKESGACLNMFYALEGAIQGIRWHNLSKERKQELKEIFYQIDREYIKVK